LPISFVVLLALLYFGGALHGDTSRYPGGANLVSLCKCVWEAMVCLGMSFALYSVFKRYFARQGRLAEFLAANAFAVYLIHPPILVALAIATRGLLDASALTKAALLTCEAAVAAYLFSAIIVRRLPLLGRILQA
jgi:peptidoglycan/LPS O-acetylase OafA/YrhL